MDKDEEKKDDDEEIIEQDPIGASTLFNATGYDGNSIITGRGGTLDFATERFNLDTGATIIGKDIRAGGIFMDSADDATRVVRLGGTQRIELATQVAMLGDSSILGDSLLGMRIQTVADTRNFLVGLNNYAVKVSQNADLLDNFTHAGIEIRTGATRLSLAGAATIENSRVFQSNVASIVAAGKAVENQFSSIAENYLKGVATIKIPDPSSVIGSISTGPFASPYTVYSPQPISVEKVAEKLPEAKKELPVKITQAIELMEHVFDSETKNNDKVITTTVSELKRAVKSIQGSMNMVVQQITQKIEITAMPKLEVVSFEKVGVNKNRFPFKIPSGTTWQNIIIQFTSEDFVNIQVAGHSHPTGYADMGFVDGRTNKPNLQWTLLRVIAKNGGCLPSSSGDARDNYKKHKQILSEKLKEYFQIEFDPFEAYKGGYQTKIVLAPPPSSPEEPNTDFSEVEDMFRDLTEE